VKLPEPALQPPTLPHILDVLYQDHRVSVDVRRSVMRYAMRINIGFVRCQQQRHFQRVVDDADQITIRRSASLSNSDVGGHDNAGRSIQKSGVNIHRHPASDSVQDFDRRSWF
jgi:hypothetical protein